MTTWITTKTAGQQAPEPRDHNLHNNFHLARPDEIPAKIPAAAFSEELLIQTRSTKRSCKLKQKIAIATGAGADDTLEAREYDDATHPKQMPLLWKCWCMSVYWLMLSALVCIAYLTSIVDLKRVCCNVTYAEELLP